MPLQPLRFGEPRPAVVGHRGSPATHPENTPEGFAAAAAAGATWVELDVRATAAGDLVVLHDPHVPDGRTLHGLRPEEWRAAGLRSLEEVLAGLPDALGVDLEVKNLPGEPDHDEGVEGDGGTLRMAVVDRLADALPIAGDRPLVVSSFNPLVLVAAADRGLPAPLALVTAGVPLPAGIEAATEVGCAGLFPQDGTEGLDAAGVAAAHAAGLAVMVWTVGDPARAAALTAMGVDALCGDDPAALAAVLRPAG